MQLLVCDWLLETRTTVWEEEGVESDGASLAPVSNAVLTGFQQNLSSLRRLTQHIPVRILYSSVISQWYKTVKLLPVRN